MKMKKIASDDHCLREFVKRFREEELLPFFSGELERDAAEYILLELLNNAQEHGNGYDSSKTILVEWTANHNHMTITVEDEGEGFTPDIPEEPPPLDVSRGRGLWSIKTDEIVSLLSFSKKGNRVSVTLRKNGVKHNE